jgi:hypothetical protein
MLIFNLLLIFYAYFERIQKQMNRVRNILVGVWHIFLPMAFFPYPSINFSACQVLLIIFLYYQVYHLEEGREKTAKFFDEDLEDHQPFPTLQTVLQELEQHVGCNIEIKWTMQLKVVINLFFI